ncbi:MAG: M48 family metalloprotease [Phycisphaerales bacterium]
MQPLPILLVLSLLLADDGFAAAGLLGVAEHPWLAPLVAVGAPALLVGLVGVLVGRHLRRVDRERHGAGLGRAERLLRRGRWGVVGLHVIAVVAAGWLDWIRGFTGDLVLLDELLALVPAVLALTGLWAVNYGLETRVANSIRIRRIDHGMPIWPTPGRAAWVFGQVRVQLGMLGVPVLLVLGAGELVHAVGGEWAAGGPSDRLPGLVASDGVASDAGVGEAAASAAGASRPADAAGAADTAGAAGAAGASSERPIPTDPARTWILDGITFVIAAGIFVLAPWIMRGVLPLAPIDSAAVRQSLGALARRAGVRVRDVLLWRTEGTMINAAVVGLIPPIRFIIVTDGLVEQLPEPALRAVLAHEIGHVRFRHVPWLAVTLAAMATLAAACSSVPSLLIGLNGGSVTGTASEVSLIATSLVMLVGGWAAFGWVARRYERQADTFAVRLLSGDDPRGLRMTVESIGWLGRGTARAAGGPGEAGEAAEPGAAGAPATPGGTIDGPGDLGVGEGVGDGMGVGEAAGRGLAGQVGPAGRGGHAGPASPAGAAIAAAGGAARPPAGRDVGDHPDAPTGAASLASPGPASTVPAEHFSPESVVAMRAALMLTASLSGMDPARKSWWHGSIDWRQSYLATLDGRPFARLPIDRVVRRLKLAALVALLGGVVSIFWLDRAFAAVEARGMEPTVVSTSASISVPTSPSASPSTSVPPLTPPPATRLGGQAQTSEMDS